MQIKKLRGRQGDEYAKHGNAVSCYGYVCTQLKQKTIKYEYHRIRLQQFCIATGEQRCTAAGFKVLLKISDCGLKSLLKMNTYIL